VRKYPPLSPAGVGRTRVKMLAVQIWAIGALKVTPPDA
jgi:hypothetical protein